MFSCFLPGDSGRLAVADQNRMQVTLENVRSAVPLVLLRLKYPTAGAKPGTVPDLKAMETMRKYNEQLQKAGVLLALDDLTPPSTMGARVTFKSGTSKVTDGPFTEAKEVVGGFWIIQVKSREEALEWASRIPGSDNEWLKSAGCWR
jgi:hypothetical protein